MWLYACEIMFYWVKVYICYWIIFNGITLLGHTVEDTHHISHWLRVADCITFRLAVLAYHCLHSSKYLSRELPQVSDVHNYQWLHSDNRCPGRRTDKFSITVAQNIIQHLSIIKLFTRLTAAIWTQTQFTQRLRSSSSAVLVISRTRRAIIDGRGFSAAAISVWNSLPGAVRSSTSLRRCSGRHWRRNCHAILHRITQ